jgi:hypothetical protein
MRFPHSFVAIILSLTLSVTAYSQARSDSFQASEVLYGESWVGWPVSVPDAGLVLTVSGPEGVYLKQDYSAGSQPRFSLLDEQRGARPNGVYKWELVIQPAGWEGSSQPMPPGSEMRSGWFEIRGGRVVAEQTSAEKQPVVVEEGAPENSLYVDREGRVGVGTSIPGVQLHLKGTDPGLAIEDTQAGGRQYLLRSHQSRDGSLGLFDETTGEARWLVDGQGRMGINTTQPTSTLTVDGYIESTKGFLVNGRPVGVGGFSFGSAQPLSTEGDSNNFFGTWAGAANTGSSNSFFGAYSGYLNTTGNLNSFFGRLAGYLNTTGSSNSFFGGSAGQANTSGSSNSFFGIAAGFSNTEGLYNSFLGTSAGYYNTTGSSNSCLGAFAGQFNATGGSNSFFGGSAGRYNVTGIRNSFFGAVAGNSNTLEHNNTFVGAYADLDPGASPGTTPVTNATAVGYRSYVSRANSLVLGSIAGLNGATNNVNVGIGTPAPGRQLHLAGPNAVFRMDRTMDTASFLLVRVSPAGALLKSFIVGTNASAVNQGEFIINDMGAAVGGAGARRMTINNAGNVQFTGTVTATDFIQASSLALKSNVRTYDQAIETVARLRGVRFNWRETGQPSVGLIAEEVREVLPELVAAQADGAATGVNYASLVAVLIEAAKAQQKTIEQERQTVFTLQQEVDGLKAELAEIKALLTRERK